MTTVYEAIHLAADHIERNPNLYNFDGYEVPKPGCVACMWGWIGFHAGLKTGTSNAVVAEIFGYSTIDLYSVGLNRFGGNLNTDDSELCDYRKAVATMREFAKSQYAPEKTKTTRKGIPSDILAIFTRTYTTEPV